MEIDTSRYYWKNGLITLRHPRAEDWESLIYHMFDSQGRFFFNEEIDLPVDVEQYKGRPEFINPEQLPYLCFAIENSQGKHVGIANLFNVNERHGTFGPIGIVINPQDRGKGYGTEAYRMLGRYLFQERRMHKWNNGYIEGNRASEALHKKLGFVVEGIQRDMYYHEGRYWNQVVCGMTETQFFENERRVFHASM